MKVIVTCCAALALAACGSSSGGTSSNGGFTNTNGNGIGNNGSGNNGSTTGNRSSSNSGSATSSSGSSATAGNSTGSTASQTAGNTSSGGIATATNGGTATAGSTSGGGVTYGAACTFNANTGADSCAVSGYECSAAFTQGAASAGTCVLPTNSGTCLSPSPGCAGDAGQTLACTPGFANSTGTAESLCLPPCTTTANCTDPLSSCISAGSSNVCFQNQCGIGQGGDGGLWGPCTSSVAGDGQCLSFGGGSFGVCYQDGTAATGATCTFTRTTSGSECVKGDFCVPGQTTSGACMLIGNGDGGFPCPSNDIIVGVISPDWGVCAQTCTGATDTSCPAGLGCQQLQTGYACLPK